MYVDLCIFNVSFFSFQNQTVLWLLFNCEFETVSLTYSRVGLKLCASVGKEMVHVQRKNENERSVKSAKRVLGCGAKPE